MGGFIRGDVVVIPFPFSDLSDAKRRPAFVVAPLAGDDVILCQITARRRSDSYAIPITNDDFTEGGLHRSSHIRPNRLFTADLNIVLRQAGSLNSTKTQEVIDKIIEIITQ